jgi:beta-glucosidase
LRFESLRVSAMKMGRAIVAMLPLLIAAAPSRAAEAPCPIAASQERPWLDNTLSAECRADALVRQLGSLDDKLAVLGGGLQRYGVTDSPASDGPAGPTHVPGGASLPNGMAVASSFDVDMAHAYGRAVGGEFRAAGILQMLGPTVDIARTWHSGRVPEAFGEDPLLSGEIAANVVRGVQERGVAATLKHFAVYEQEQGRTGDLPFGLNAAVNNVVSERVIREIYLAPFRAAVQEGGALGVMCGFPRINGVYACENSMLLGILKNEWGFRGTVAPDFPDAQRSVVAAVNAGLDMGNLGVPREAGPAARPAATPDANLGAALGLGAIPGGVSLHDAAVSGRVSAQRLDDMIRRRLIVLFAAQAAGASPLARQDTAANGVQELALRIAEQGAVLLRNEAQVLPLAAQVKSIVVLGAQAGAKPQAATSGSAYIEPARAAAAIDEIRLRAGTSARVTYVRGSLGLDALPAIPTAVLHTPEGGAGLRVEYFGNPRLDFAGRPLFVRIDPSADVRGPMPIAGLPANNGWSTRWSGTLTPRNSGVHHFTLSGAGSGRLYLDDRLVARFDRVDFGAVAYAAATLEGGHSVRLRVEFTPREAAPIPGLHMMGTTLGTLLHLGWAEPDDSVAQAVAAARQADVAIIFAADRQGEGADRTGLALPGDQNELIAAVAAANPSTVVVLSTAGPVSMPWANKVAAILETWYAGDAFGTAVTRLLFGDAAPGGRLPITFPMNEQQGPLSLPSRYPGTVSSDGSLAEAHFDEGLLVGYRWFDATQSKPLYPFGHGLTYSRMRVDHFQVETSATEPRIKATISNVGSHADAEVLQVYLRFPDSASEPPRRLVAFKRVELAAAESRDIELTVPARAFEVWDAQAHRWHAPSGRYEIFIGRSSREILFRHSFDRP